MQCIFLYSFVVITKRKATTLEKVVTDQAVKIFELLLQHTCTVAHICTEVRNDCGRPEDDLVLVGRDLGAVDLLGKVGHVVRESEEMFLVLVRTRLAGDRPLFRFVTIAESAVALDSEHVGIGDTVVEHDTAGDLEVVRGL